LAGGRHARAAGRDPGHRCRGLVTRRLVGDLHKNLVLLDHAEFETGALLDRIVPLLEITHFGIEARVTHLELLVGFLLLLQLPIDIPDPQPAALAQPQRMLQQDNHHQQRNSQPAHRSGGRKPGGSGEIVEGVTARIAGRVPQILLDPQQLVVLGDAIGT
jgi:hypothetical protein